MIERAKNYWKLLIGGFVALLIVLGIIGAIVGEPGVSKETCEQIDWEGRQCQALEVEEFEERFGNGKFERQFRQAQREARER